MIIAYGFVCCACVFQSKGRYVQSLSNRSSESGGYDIDMRGTVPSFIALLLRRSQPEVTTIKVLNRGPTSVSFHCEPFLLFDQHGDHSPRNAWVPGW
jgi:hypothetical protein